MARPRTTPPAPSAARPNRSPRWPSGTGVSPQQVCLAWELARSPVVIPIPGASRPEAITDPVAAADLKLTEDDLALLP